MKRGIRSIILAIAVSCLMNVTGTIAADNDKTFPGSDFFSFDVNQPVTVYVAHDPRIESKPSWLNTFTLIEGVLDTSDQSTTLSLYSQTFPAGTVTLGRNQTGNLGKVSMYSVSVVPEDGPFTDTTPPSIPSIDSVVANSATDVTITWSEATDNVAVTGYTLYRNGCDGNQHTHSPKESRMIEQETISPPTIKPLLGEFPTDTLAEPVKAFVEHASRSLVVPTDFLALPVMADISVGIGNTRHIELKPDYAEPPSFYFALVGDTGDRKSPALKVGLRSLGSCYNSGDNRRFASDVTVERLAELLNLHSKGILIYQDELAALIRSHNQYRGGKGADRQFYLSLWSGSTLTVDRKNGTDLVVPNPFASIVGGIQPDILSELVDSQGKEDGSAVRYLYAWPDSAPCRWTDYSVPDSVTIEYDSLLEKLYNLKYEHIPVRIPLTPAASTFYIRWHDSHCIEGEDANLSPFMKGAFSKLKGYCGRLALIHAMCLDPNMQAVGVESIAAAAAQIEYFKRQAFKVDAALPQKKNDPLERAKTAIRRRLSVCRHLKRRELQRTIKCTAEIFNQALTEMSNAELRIDENKNVIWNELVPNSQENST